MCFSSVLAEQYARADAGGQVHACGGLTGMGPIAEAGQGEQLAPQALLLEPWLNVQVNQVATGWAHSAFVTGGK